MEWLRVWGLLGLCVLSRAQQDILLPSPARPASYLLLAPSEVCEGVPFTLSISILTSDPKVLVTCQLQGNFFNASATTSIRGGQGRSLSSSCPAPQAPLLDSSLTLLVSGLAGPTRLFNNVTRLRVRNQDISSFIQTDKPTYRPGDTVRIRVVSIGVDRRPHKSPVNIVIKDPRGNIIRQWLSLNSTLGVVTQELQLSDHPPLGHWTIQTTVADVASQNQFNVAYYVLPKFEVRISAPSVVYHMDLLFGSVTAQYTYGKPVLGQMVVTYIRGGAVITSDEPVMIDGSAHFELDLSNYPGVSRSHDGHEAVTVVVNVTESLTGLTYSSDATVFVERSRYKISFECTPSVLKPSLNFTAKLRISSYNGQPLTPDDQMKTVSVTVMQHRVQPWPVQGIRDPQKLNGSSKPADGIQEMEFLVPANGVLPLFIRILDDIESLEIDASLEDTYETLSLRSIYRSPSQSYLQIQKPTTPAQVGMPLLLPVESNFKTSQFFYIVRSRNRTLGSGSFSGPLALTPEASWAPMACLVVYCTRADGEVVNDVLLLPVPLELQNKVSLKWTEDQRQPGEEVSLRLSVSEPQSLVGILVVDAATYQRDSRNDITTESVLKELYGGMSEQHRPDEWSMGDPKSLFESCGLIVLTDATLNSQKTEWSRLELFMRGNEEESQEPRERRNFPETWLWMNVNTGEATTSEMTVTVPDSITTWRATAFVMSENLGLGILDTPAQLTVFQDFFMSLNLPASIVRGEELVLEVNLYNYLSADLQVMVTVAHSDSFEFVFPDAQGLSMASSREVLVQSNGGAHVRVPIRPLALGQMPISVKAMSSVASDAILQNVLVKAEGLEQFYSTTLFVELSPNTPMFVRELKFYFPADVVADSERAEVTVVGDLMGPSIDGLDSLIRMPYGCGEQNMIHFAPNVYVLQYLDATGQSAPETVATAILYMGKGYERQLSYQRTDGSFSAFGESDLSGSTWLSAFVMRSFLPARKFIPIDPNVLARTASWLSLQQGPDGRYLEPGRVIHTELQGGLDGPASLTAYVLTGLLQDDAVRSQYSTQVSEALMYLETQLAVGISSNYSLCLVTYALALSGSSSATSAWDTLVDRAQVRDGVPFWTASSPGLAQSWQPRTADIEMAAYALLSLHKLGRFEEGIPIMKWLSQQRNHLGGYGSTQDTVVALQALSTVAFAGAASLNLTIMVTSGDSVPVATFNLDPINYMVQQSQQIDAAGNIELHIAAAGQGVALVQLNVFYNIDNTDLARRKRDVGDEEAFQLNIELFDGRSQSAHLSVCFRLVDEQDLDRTGMALLEVGLLSGFTLAQEGVQTNDNIMKVEEEPGKVIVYLDSVSRAEQCVEIPLFVENMVAKVQHASVIIVDYYEPRRRTVRSYTSIFRQKMDSCTFCGEDCSQCGDNPSDYSSAASTDHHPLLALLLCPLLVILSYGV
ncbi:unnamed protein product [Lota lota]